MLLYVPEQGVFISGCRFECDQLLYLAALAVDVNGGAEVRSCTFIAQGNATDQPPMAVRIVADVTPLSSLEMIGCTIDAGAYGWENSCSLDCLFLGMESCSLLRGVDMDVDPAIQGFVNVQTSTGGSRVSW